jgi:hypothetical protein
MVISVQVADPDHQEKRLAVVSDNAMISWLEEYSQVEDFGYDKLLTQESGPYRFHG